MAEIGLGLSALLLTNDVLAPDAKISLDKALTVQHLTYGCSKKRTSAGNPYGATLPSFLEFTVRILKEKAGKVFLERMAEPETHPYSFVFYNKDSEGNLVENGIIVASGYAVSLEESTRTVTTIEQVNGDDGNKKDVPKDDEQLHLTVKIMLSNLVFKGKDGKNLSLIITND